MGLIKEVEFYSDTRAAIKKHSGEELDIKPYEADMRHLINTYIQADAADPLGTVDNYSLVELIIQTGIHDAIAKKLNEKGKLSKNAIAEGIINNARKTIIRNQLTDPRFYAEMSKLLDDLIQQRRQETKDYEKFLERAEALVKQLGRKEPTDGVPAILHGKPEAIVLFTNLADILAGGSSVVKDESPLEIEQRAAIALKLDLTMRQKAPAGWKEDIEGPKGKQVLNALFPVMDKNREATLAIFEIIKHQLGY